MKFEWDKEKNKLNKEKHGISFDEITEIFLDERSIYVPANTIGGENRFAVIGQAKNKKIFICIHIERDEKIRIISARRARKKEEELWDQNQ